MSKASIRIGTSGFSYKDWLGNFYPQFCPHLDFLQFYSSKFNCVEIDSTYYRIPAVSTVEKWNKVTPKGFLFTAKFPSTVTHEGSTVSRIEISKQFIEVMRVLGDKLGPLLLQFPYSFKPEQKKMLFELIESLPEGIRYAIELRNKKWLNEADLFELLKEKGIAFCLIDHPWMPRVKTLTADFTYLRFLGDRKKIENDFSFVRFERNEELAYWSELLLEFADQDVECFGFFNNHYSGHAPTTAQNLQSLLVENRT